MLNATGAKLVTCQPRDRVAVAGFADFRFGRPLCDSVNLVSKVHGAPW